MDAYKRVTAEDGSWKRPKIPANQLRKKGQFYFEAMEVTGSTVAVKIKTAKAITFCPKEISRVWATNAKPVSHLVL